MEIFISWSGSRSHAVATALHDWLPKIINDLRPWLSSADIGKGARWSVDVAARLNAAKAGIICLTPNNLHSDWILFEAGALSKAVENANVCTFLIGLEPSDLEPPLSQFQATKAEEADILKLLQTLNQGLGENALPREHVAGAFEMGWPKLKSDLEKIPADETSSRPVRSERQLLEEILDLVRGQSRPAIASLTEEDRESVVKARAAKIIFESGTAQSFRTRKEGSGLRIDVTGRGGGEYVVTIPRDLQVEEIEKCVSAQLPTNEVPPATDGKTAGP